MTTYDALNASMDCTCSMLNNIGLSVLKKHPKMYPLIGTLTSMFGVTNIENVAVDPRFSGAGVNTCWMTVESIEVDDFAPINLPTGCEPPIRVGFDKVTCSSLKHKAYVLRNSVVQNYNLCNTLSPDLFAKTYISKVLEKFAGGFLQRVLDLLYASVLVNCVEETYQKYSLTGALVDKSTVGLAVEVVDEVVDTLGIAQGESPMDIWMLVDTKGFRQYMDDMRTKYPYCVCGNVTEYLTYKDSRTGINFLILPTGSFKTDGSGNPIYVAFLWNYFSMKMGVPQTMLNNWFVLGDGATDCYASRVISDDVSGDLFALVRWAKTCIDYTAGFKLDLWIALGGLKMDKNGFMFVVGKK